MWSARGGTAAIVRGALIRRFHHSEFDLPAAARAQGGAGHRGAAGARGGGHDRRDRGAAARPRPADRPGAGGGRGVRATARAEIAARAGAEVHQEAELHARVRPGARQGRRDVAGARRWPRGELVVYLDSDTRDFSPHFALGMLGPLICEPDVRFVKGFFRRPYRPRTGRSAPVDGGRVTELTARPLLSAFFPELAAFVQPLAGEVAARRSLLRADPVRHRLRGRDGDAAARARPARRHRRHGPGGPRRAAQPPPAAPRRSGPMAYAVLRVILERLRAEGRLLDDHAPAVPDGRRRAGPGRARGAAAVRHARAPARSGDQVRLHRPRRHAARQGGVALPHR